MAGPPLHGCCAACGMHCQDSGCPLKTSSHLRVQSQAESTFQRAALRDAVIAHWALLTSLSAVLGPGPCPKLCITHLVIVHHTPPPQYPLSMLQAGTTPRGRSCRRCSCRISRYSQLTSLETIIARHRALAPPAQLAPPPGAVTDATNPTRSCAHLSFACHLPEASRDAHLVTQHLRGQRRARRRCMTRAARRFCRRPLARVQQAAAPRRAQDCNDGRQRRSRLPVTCPMTRYLGFRV